MNEHPDIYDQIMIDAAEDAATRDHHRRLRGEYETPNESPRPKPKERTA